jgi:hypothetical protein
VQLGLTLTALSVSPLYTPQPAETLASMGFTGRMGCRPGHSLERGLSHALMQAGPKSYSGSGFLQRNRPLLFLLFHFLF